ncbi:ArnT family glycosyltransferase [Elusimicrobiota bacterium]
MKSSAASAGWDSPRVLLCMLGAVFAAALVLRLTGIGYGLPAVFNGDEPHHVNVAVSFGRGTLNPGIFKYPTLWMYVLFASYGLYFLAWSGLGMLHSVAEFGRLFVWHPEGFYLIARLLSAALSAGALYAVYRAGAAITGRAGLWATALLAVSPTLVVSAHAAKPDSLMFFCAACAWWAGLSYYAGGRRLDLLLCGVAAGLAASAQYVAAPLAALVACAWWARRLSTGRTPPLIDLWIGLAAVPTAFFAGSPFILLDWPAFWRDVRDVTAMANVGSRDPLAVMRNALNFGGHWAVGGLLLLAGAAWLCLRRRPLAAMLLIPIAAQIAFLSFFPNGTWARFLLGVFPGLALVAGLAVHAALDGRKSLVAPLAALALLMAPGARTSHSFVAELLRPDTRNLASDWIAAHIPPGKSILTFNEHSSPRMTLSREHVARLLKQTRDAGHPRQKYYQLMADSHPGGGYEVYRIAQSPEVLHSPPGQVAWSARGRAILDVREGLASARAAGIQFVAYTSSGSSPRGFKALERFLAELRTRGELIKEFVPAPGTQRGPVIRIFRLAQEIK